MILNDSMKRIKNEGCGSSSGGCERGPVRCCGRSGPELAHLQRRQVACDLIELVRVECCQTAEMSLSKVSLDGRLAVIAGPKPPSEDCFCSDRVQVLHWRVDEPYSDDGSHLHQRSDEVYVVLEGAIELDVDGVVTTVTTGEAATVGSGVSHAIVAVQGPARGLTIRGPAVNDKVITGQRSSQP